MAAESSTVGANGRGLEHPLGRRGASPVPCFRGVGREEGTVMVALEVDASGRVRDARIHESSGHARLDEAALRSVSHWAFRPATRQGEPVAQRVLVPVAFRLDRKAGRMALPSAASIAGSLMCLLGSLVWLFGFVWSVVLAKRRSILWLSCMVAAWIVTYPVFVAVHWSVARRSLAVVLGGVFLLSVGLYIAPAA
ncbi:energy transducer TonB [Frateuria sp. GZRR33]|uniref:energy transducer TonB n=1 Tax=Frateuria sp. GZRR33 TaxID=3351535 RepID=UPI003EDBA625